MKIAPAVMSAKTLRDVEEAVRDEVYLALDPNWQQRAKQMQKALKKCIEDALEEHGRYAVRESVAIQPCKATGTRYVR